MAYTRVASTDLLVSFTIGATSTPTATNVGKLITDIYKQCYTIAYGTGHYSADETTDTLTIIGTDDMFSFIMNYATMLTDLWHYAGKDAPKPSFRMTKDDKEEVISIMFKKIAESTGMVRNISLWNEDVDSVIVR